MGGNKLLGTSSSRGFRIAWRQPANQDPDPTDRHTTPSYGFATSLVIIDSAPFLRHEEARKLGNAEYNFPRTAKEPLL